MKLGHVHIKVRNIKKSEEFYKLLGFKIQERVANYLFLTLGESHHDLALQELPNASNPSFYSTGLYHFALEVKDMKEFLDIYKKLKKNKINVSPIDHGISKAIYFEDPDGNGVEVYLDTRHEKKDWKGFSSLLNMDELLKNK